MHGFPRGILNTFKKKNVEFILAFVTPPPCTMGSLNKFSPFGSAV